MEQTVRVLDRDVIDTAVPLPHQAVLIELPVLVAMRPEPLALGVVQLVHELVLAGLVGDLRVRPGVRSRGGVA